jgi:uncharacterized protein YqgC (DUF456 family)
MVCHVNLTEVDSTVTILCGIAILVGIAGVVIPALPGLLLCWVAVLAWALLAGAGSIRWVVLAVATLILLLGVVVKYALPGRSLKSAGVPNRSLLVGGALGAVGFFVIPVVGLFVGFVLGVYLAEQFRQRDSRRAWASTRHALKAAGLSVLVEVTAALAIAATWATGVALS